MVFRAVALCFGQRRFHDLHEKNSARLGLLLCSPERRFVSYGGLYPWFNYSISGFRGGWIVLFGMRSGYNILLVLGGRLMAGKCQRLK